MSSPAYGSRDDWKPSQRNRVLPRATNALLRMVPQ